MFMYLLQNWIWALLFFLLGALLAALVVRALYRPIDEVRADLSATTHEGVRR